MCRSAQTRASTPPRRALVVRRCEPRIVPFPRRSTMRTARCAFPASSTRKAAAVVPLAALAAPGALAAPAAFAALADLATLVVLDPSARLSSTGVVHLPWVSYSPTCPLLCIAFPVVPLPDRSSSPFRISRRLCLFFAPRCPPRRPPPEGERPTSALPSRLAGTRDSSRAARSAARLVSPASDLWLSFPLQGARRLFATHLSHPF